MTVYLTGLVAGIALVGLVGGAFSLVLSPRATRHRDKGGRRRATPSPPDAEKEVPLMNRSERGLAITAAFPTGRRELDYCSRCPS